MKDLINRFKTYWGKSPISVKICIVLMLVYCIAGLFVITMPLYMRVDSDVLPFSFWAFLGCLAIVGLLFLIIKYVEYDNINKARKIMADEMRVSNLEGAKKRVAFLNDDVIEAENRVDIFTRFVRGEIPPELERELDWAIAGGIAEGLAGAAAGVATAIEVQRKNIEIKERNAVRIQNHAKLRLTILNDLLPYAERILRMAKRKSQDAEFARVDNSIDKQVLMEHLEISEPIIYQTKSGNYALKAKIRLKKGTKEKLPVFEGCDTAIDGCILTEIYCNHKKVAYAFLALPKYGIYSSDKEEDAVPGVCFDGVFEGYDKKMKVTMFKKKAGVTYTVDYLPYKLWAIEK